MNLRRAKTVYAKELTDILRDRRTLIAMVLVPLVLYPLLMLGGIQAVSIQTVDLDNEKIIVGFASKADWDTIISGLLYEEKARIADLRAAAASAATSRGDDTATDRDDLPVPLVDRMEPVLTLDLEAAIRRRTVHCGIIVEGVEDTGTLTERTSVKILYQPEAVRSENAARHVREALERVAEARVRDRLARLSIDERTIEPISITEERLSTPGSVLGLILPLILVLMTITGAIYPALDLTAGERERGTLETLMVCPVPVLDLVVGKFLVVTTIAILGAGLNLASVTATVYVGGLEQAMTTGADSGGFPFRTLPIVLLSLIPFAVLMSAIMIAVGSCARTFKEAQNYIAPVILAVLIPGGIAALPATTLTGVMIVTPVANMVLLTRELLSGAKIPPATFFWVLLSTSLYAAVAVAIAAQVFGRESVVFSDSVSLRSLVARRWFRPSRYPSLSAAALYTVVLFPAWFYVQSSLEIGGDGDVSRILYGGALFMPVFFVAIPFGLLRFRKVDPSATFATAVPKLRHLMAAVAVGVSAWVPAHEMFVFQEVYVAAPPALDEMNKAIHAALMSMPVPLVFVVIAVIPAFCEELFFRGFLLNGLRTSLRRWPAILLGACAFAAFHFVIFKFAVTGSLGVLLGWLCLRARSIWPAVLAHALHNGVTVAGVLLPEWSAWLGMNPDDPWAHLPPGVLAAGGALLVFGLVLAGSAQGPASPPSLPANEAIPRPVR